MTFNFFRQVFRTLILYFRVYIERGTGINDRNMLKLYITNIENSDAGKYTCQQLEVNPSNGVERVAQEVITRLEIISKSQIKSATKVKI